MTAGYRGTVTGGAGGVSLRAAGEQHAHVAQNWLGIVVPVRSGMRTGALEVADQSGPNFRCCFGQLSYTSY